MELNAKELDHLKRVIDYLYSDEARDYENEGHPADHIFISVLGLQEILWRGSQRFHDEFAIAAGLISTRGIDVRPIISHSFPLGEAKAAFEQAGDRSAACKVQLTFSAD